jgi:AmiR/NasT family two-component response regulator
MTRSVVTAHQHADHAAEMIDTLQALLEIERERSDAMKQAVQAARRTGMAIGMIMAHRGIDDDQAFARLHAMGQGIHAQLLEVVEAVIAGRLTP